MDKVNQDSGKIVGCAIGVHRNLGPGLLESVYEAALSIEFQSLGLSYERQKVLPVSYKGQQLGEFRLDFLIEKLIVVELKSVDRFDPVFEAQTLGYMRLGGYKVGLLINFNVPLLKNGIKRYVL